MLVASGGGPFELPAPGAGETWPITHGSAIYDALVINGCGSTSVFPVELRSTVGEQANAFSEFNQIGEFMGADDSTLQPNGFWTFAYEIRATGTNGGVSDFKFRGLVRITCSNLTAFPS